MRSSIWVGAAVVVCVMALASPASAVPSFARKHGMNCSDCHMIYPKLTPLGRRFKDNGYRFPDDDTSWRELLRSVPGSMRGGFRESFSNDRLGPEIGSFKPVVGGGASRWISFWLDWPLSVSSEGLENVRGEHYWVRVNDVLRRFRDGLLSVKAGQFELDLPFTQSRSYNLFPYTPYDLAGSSAGSLASPHRGIEISGRLGRGFQYSFALGDVLERSSFEDDLLVSTAEDPFDVDPYCRLSKTIGELNRVGLFARSAKDFKIYRLVEVVSLGPFPLDMELRWHDDVKLVGMDADWLLANKRFNLYGLFLWGRQERALDSDPWQKRDFRGGFAQLDTRLIDSLTLVARSSWTRSETENLFVDEELFGFPRMAVEEAHSFVVGFQWLPLERLKVAFEYQVFTTEDVCPGRGIADSTCPPRGAFAVDFVL